MKNKTKLEEKLVIGLMTGTSLDGVDVALVKITPEDDYNYEPDELPDLSVKMLASLLFPFPDKLKNSLKNIIEGNEYSLKDHCILNFQLAEILSEAARNVVEFTGATISDVDLIGSHGQTIFHVPSDEKINDLPIRSTLQIGEPSIIAHRTGVDTIADFRPRDIAAGGQGAPLVCYADRLLFQSSTETRLIQNIGGIGNVTVLPFDKQPYAFDTGPGNTLIDLVARKYFNIEYDNSGKLAYSGDVNEEWIDFVIQKESYFSKLPPKSTGRELFNYSFLENILNEFPINNKENLIASVSALTARTIAKSYKDFILNRYTPDLIILGGGGAYNPFIIEKLDEYLDNKIPIKSHEDFGISNKFKEAIAFAILAYTSYYNIPNNVPGCTGAKEAVVLGKFIPGS